MSCFRFFDLDLALAMDDRRFSEASGEEVEGIGLECVMVVREEDLVRRDDDAEACLRALAKASPASRKSSERE